jgi:diazepam-binding inhibitor (GABA receptor modulating acyl-CoA-binding protein)
MDTAVSSQTSSSETVSSELFHRFKHCTEIIKDQTNVSNEDLAILYGNYKQVIMGDNMSERPFFINFVATGKWDAWTACKGKSKEEAMHDYIQKVEEILKA